MREALGPYRAGLTQTRRRSLILLLIIAVGIFGAIAWSTFRSLQTQRNVLQKLESARITPENFFEFSPGVTCFGEGPVAPLEPGTEPGIKPVPSGPVMTCQFIDPTGEPFGPTFTEDPSSRFGGSPSQEFIDEIRPQLIDAARKRIADTEKTLAPTALFENRVRAFGTFYGIVFIVVLASTLLGAEVRWGVWRTLLTHEPRRGRLLATKFAVLWTCILVAFGLALAVSTAVDAVMRVVLDVDASGGPSIGHLVEQTGWAALSLATFGTIAAALVVSIRTTVAGIATLLLLLGDHLLVSKFVWLRVFFPTQQVAWLLPQPETLASGYAWFPRILVRFQCVRTTTEPFPICQEVMLKPIPHWRASLVLGGWVIAFALAAWGVLRARDVPQ